MENNQHDAAEPQEIEMKKVVFSDAKGSSGKPMWVLMPDGSLIISQEAVDQASIRYLKLSA